MGLREALLGKRRRPLTLEQVALLAFAHAAKAAWEGEACLFEILREAGARFANEVQSEYEVLTFLLAGSSIVIRGRERPYEPLIRGHVIEQMAQSLLDRIPDPEVAEAFAPDKTRPYFQGRIKEYVEAFDSAPPGEEFERMGRLVAVHFSTAGNLEALASLCAVSISAYMHDVVDWVESVRITRPGT